MNIQVLKTLLPVLLGKKRSWVAIGLLLLVGSQFGGLVGLPQLSLGLDRFWSEPRDVLVDRVEDAREAQQDTVEQFRTAMEEFKSVTGFDGGDLETKFNQLNDAFLESEAASQNIDKRVDRVVSATNRLLEEWREELEQYHDESIRARAETQFDKTRTRAEQMIGSMRNAASKTKPVLDAFRDQVLYLKHNLNMQAVTAIDAQTAEIEGEVEDLIREMEVSIAEATAFIDEMGKAE